MNAAPRIKAPKMIIAGRYDETTSLRIETEPLYAMLPEPKKLLIHEGGHIPHRDLAIRELNDWFDRTLGPVQ